MKVLKISKNLIKQLEEMDLLLQGVAKKSKNNKILVKNTKSIFEIKKLYQESMPVELSVLNNLLIELDEILRFLIAQKLDFKKFVLNLDRISKLIDKSAKNAYYDFFRLCGKCASCCKSPHVFSFEHDFIDKHHKFLKKKGLSYIVKSNPKTGLCTFYDKKNRKCVIYNERPLDCTFFPFTFVIKKITAPAINAKPRNYIFLCKATRCDVMNRLSLNDSLEALEIICYILSKITLEEAIIYSNEADPRKIMFDVSIPYDDRITYHKALKQILHTRLYRKNPEIVSKL